MRVGVLSVQGAFAEMAAHWRALGAETFEIRQRSDLDRGMDFLALPGGESTVQGKLLRELGLFAPLKRKIAGGLPTLGTCAGLILLAKSIKDDPTVHFGLLDVIVERNAYGRQLGSFHAEAPLTDGPSVPLTFIRAPRIVSAGPSVEPLVTLDGTPVAVRQGHLFAAAFHPEIDANPSFHRLFLAAVSTRPVGEASSPPQI